MRDIFIHKNNTIIETLVKLQKVGSQCLIVVNKNYSLLGSISDGDVRRARIFYLRERTGKSARIREKKMVKK